MTERALLPHLSRDLFLTDGGLETTLIFHDEFDLPDFAAFPLLDSEAGRQALKRYYTAYIDIARRHDTALVLETPTWRASADWGLRLGYDTDALHAINTAAVDHLRAIQAEHIDTTIVISGNLGPRGDGYSPTSVATADEAQHYHRDQIHVLSEAGADVITALTITHVDEAIGIVRAAVEHDIEVVISFTVEVDGSLSSGQALDEAITALDEATDAAAAYIMINCAHPTHVMGVLDPSSTALARVRGVRANASTRSHAELDEADELDAGDTAELAALYRDLTDLLPNLTVMGGCCGTDYRHIEAIAAVCAPLFRRDDAAGPSGRVGTTPDDSGREPA